MTPAWSDAPLNLASAEGPIRPVMAVRPDELAPELAKMSPELRGYVEGIGFTGAAQELCLLPGPVGVAGALLGLGTDRSPFAFGGLANRLPAGVWRIEPGEHDAQAAVLGFLLGGYRLPGGRRPRATAVLADDGDPATARAALLARAAWMGRDLINLPANRLGPAELADVALALAGRHGAVVERIEGDALAEGYPAIAAVGAGSPRKPVVAAFTWRGTEARNDSPLVSLCGKGVCFDTGGLDLKPPASMLRMKKDMGGAAIMLALARAIMEANLPVRLAVRIGCVENSVSGEAMRPLDVIATRRGLSVEIGNTDAEGRLVLADLLAAASDEDPSILLDAATLTGAARVALGPDLPALFCDDDELASTLTDAGMRANDPLWRMPLWSPYDAWLDSSCADMNNVSSKTHAGAVVAALFLRRFVKPGVKWAHLDVYAWNDATGPGRPEGGEAQAFRGLFAHIEGSRQV